MMKATKISGVLALTAFVTLLVASCGPHTLFPSDPWGMTGISDTSASFYWTKTAEPVDYHLVLTLGSDIRVLRKSDATYCTVNLNDFMDDPAAVAGIYELGLGSGMFDGFQSVTSDVVDPVLASVEVDSTVQQHSFASLAPNTWYAIHVSQVPDSTSPWIVNGATDWGSIVFKTATSP